MLQTEPTKEQRCLGDPTGGSPRILRRQEILPNSKNPGAYAAGLNYTVTES